ncbi:MAG: ribonuclease HII [Bacteroidales bacterium]|jgi:ribonuclease HII|nr:ribonuclease HII [Bacteroidales bacterium]
MESFYQTEKYPEAGCDEAGRGCLAGPVVAAAVIFPPDYFNKNINDSKQLSEKKRFILRDEIIKDAVCWGVASCSNEEIDQINILQASITAMHRALDMLSERPKFIIVDGNKFRPYGDIPYQTVVKGDAKFLSIAAASILAKTYRDEWICNAAKDYPVYNWQKNKGYPTKEHRLAILEHGVCPLHRMSYEPCQPKLF